MRFNLRENIIYALTCGNKQRNDNLRAIAGIYDLNILIFEGVKSELLGKYRSGASGFARIIIHHLTKEETFKPFVIIEDDVSVYLSNFSFDIPEDTDAVWLGISAASISPHGAYDERKLDLSEVDGYPHILRDRNMLSTHAIYFASERYCKHVLKLMIDIITRSGVVWDIPIAIDKKKFNIYCLKRPIFYQQGSIGGMEPDTKIELKATNIHPTQHGIDKMEYAKKTKGFIIPHLVGGLGNRLFILAAALGESIIQGKELVISSDYWKPNPHSVTDYNYFFRGLRQIDYKPTNFFVFEEQCGYCLYGNIDKTKQNLIMHGYFQTEKYFIHIKEDIINRFGPPPDKSIPMENSAFIHFRRGDFIGNSNHEKNLDNYYQDAMKLFNGVERWFIFSDDIEHVKKIEWLQGLDNVTFIGKEKTEVETLWMMSLCNGGICANSTFSWWGSYLQKNVKYPRCFPSWYTIDFPDVSVTDLIPDGFTIINCR